MKDYFEKHSQKHLCECMHWRHEHVSKRSWIMGVLFGGVPGKCHARGMWGRDDVNCQCEGFELHSPLRDKGKNNE